MPTAETENKRFEFGGNWKNFLKRLNNARIQEAEDSLAQKTGLPALQGKNFLDMGCGSGLFSLAARNMGAKVRSFDYDRDSVACAIELKNRFRNGDPDWIIEQGSALDQAYLASLGRYDIVYSWGVLHHTGDMYAALENAIKAVNNNGILFISIYNDQGAASRRWRAFKKFYVSAPKPVKLLMALFVIARFSSITFVKRLLSFKSPLPPQERGMHLWYNAVDWAGGYPFEVARPEEILEFCKNRGLTLLKLTTSGSGCNEYVFVKTAPLSAFAQNINPARASHYRA